MTDERARTDQPAAPDDAAATSQLGDGRMVTFHGLAGPVANEDLVESVPEAKVPRREDDPNVQAALRVPSG